MTTPPIGPVERGTDGGEQLARIGHGNRAGDGDGESRQDNGECAAAESSCNADLPRGQNRFL